MSKAAAVRKFFDENPYASSADAAEAVGCHPSYARVSMYRAGKTLPRGHAQYGWHMMLSLPPDVADRIRTISAETEQTPQELIRNIIADWLD